MIGGDVLRLERSPLYLGLLSQVLQYGFGLLILPLALSRLQPSEFGLWNVFLVAQSLVMLLDFGFAHTFARNFAYVFAGAQRLMREGVETVEVGEVNEGLLVFMISTAQRLYLIVALISAGVLTTAGSLYIHHVSSEASLPPGSTWFSWGVFVVAIAANIYFQWQTSLLIGANRVQKNYQVTILSRVVQLAVSIVGLLLYPSLSVLVVGYAASVVVMRIYSYLCIRDLIPGTKASPEAEQLYPPRELFAVLWHNSSRLGLVLLGAFLVTRFSTFTIAYFLGLTVSAQYAIAFQAYAVIQSLSQVAFAVYLPRISAARVSGDQTVVRLLFARSILFAWLVFFTLSLALLVGGPFLLQLIGSKTSLPPLGVLVAMGLVWLLESNHSNCASVIVSSNKVPFVTPSLISGAAIAIGTTIAGMVGAGLVTFVIIQGLVQLAYNNWKWPLVVFQDLDLRGRDLFHVVRSRMAT